MDKNRLNETKIGDAKVIVDIVPKGYCIPNVKITPTSITIHNTGNVGASAKANHNYMKNINKSGARTASWHFTVDDKEIYQAQSTNYKCYHAGHGTGNNTSIGIEICMFEDKQRQKKAYQNAIELVKVLMAYHKFSPSQVKRHKDWSGKHCPAWLIDGKFGFTWDWFKSEIGIKQNISDSNTIPYVVKVIYEGKDGLNVRSEANASSKVNAIIYFGQAYTIVEEKNGWGKLKSGVGWISLNSKYVKKI